MISLAHLLLCALTQLPGPPSHRLGYSYANDLFFHTDYYFTQGMTFDVVSPTLGRWPTRRALPGLAGSPGYYGVQVRYDGFTPLRLDVAQVQWGDRPYAAYFYAAFYRTSWRATARQQLTAALEVGYIGPAAGGKFVQTRLHALTHGTEPLGWDNQVRSDAVLGYRLGYERRLLAAGRWLALAGTAEASLGTLYTYAGAGIRLRAGRVVPGGAGLGGASAGWQLYAEATLAGRLVGYDATLQGGFFNRHSPYTLAFAEVRHAVPRGMASLVFAHGGLSLRATAVAIGPELTGGRPHRWGELALAREF